MIACPARAATFRAAAVSVMELAECRADQLAAEVGAVLRGGLRGGLPAVGRRVRTIRRLSRVAGWVRRRYAL